MEEVIVFGASRDADAMLEVCERLRAVERSCAAYPLSGESESWRDSGVLNAIEGCCVAVFVFSEDANDNPAVSACVSMLFRQKKAVIPFRLDRTQYSAELDYCLGPAQHVDASYDFLSALSRLADAVNRLLVAPPKTPQPHPLRKWFVAIGIVLTVILGWRLFGPVGRSGFAVALEPVLETSLNGIVEDVAEEIGNGLVQVVMLDGVTGDYTAFELEIRNNKPFARPRNLARKNAVLNAYDADRLMIPILAAAAMKCGGVRRAVALGDADWSDADVSYWNRMLGEEALLRELSSLHLSTALQGHDIAAEARRFSAAPYHLLQGFLGIVGEAMGSPGFDYCGGRENAKSILRKMKYDDGFGLLSGAVMVEEGKGKGSRWCNVAGAVGYDDPCCLLFVRVEIASGNVETDAEAEAMNLWHTVGLLALAADRKWGGNGR